MNTRINDLPDTLRPRERMAREGASALSDAELIAIFLRVGVKGESAIDVGRRLLATHGSLGALGQQGEVHAELVHYLVADGEMTIPERLALPFDGFYQAELTEVSPRVIGAVNFIGPWVVEGGPEEPPPVQATFSFDVPVCPYE